MVNGNIESVFLKLNFKKNSRIRHQAIMNIKRKIMFKHEEQIQMDKFDYVAFHKDAYVDSESNEIA